MTEPELRTYFNHIMAELKRSAPDDLIGWMLVGFQENGITQYVSSVDPMTAPDALRELADRLESRTIVERN